MIFEWQPGRPSFSSVADALNHGWLLLLVCEKSALPSFLSGIFKKAQISLALQLATEGRKENLSSERNFSFSLLASRSRSVCVETEAAINGYKTGRASGRRRLLVATFFFFTGNELLATFLVVSAGGQIRLKQTLRHWQQFPAPPSFQTCS